ncbi:MAG: hypothetical protein IJI46_02015 [Erysipelotrichaceae bacterium]|nr:hypothetical protein [Erysipelotrichaceae bacterium]
MKKRFVVILAVLMILLAGCSNGKTVKTREEGKKMCEEFFDGLLDADPITMSSYQSGVLFSVFSKDQDKIHVDYPDSGYGYYGFIGEDGKKYIITDDGSAMEDEFTYDVSLDTVKNMLLMSTSAYFDVEDDSMSFVCSEKDGKELSMEIKGRNEGVDFTITANAAKEDGKISAIKSEIKSGEQSYQSEYRFTYDEHIELPDYSLPKTYDDLPHVESPYASFGEIIDKLGEEDNLFYCFMDDQLLVIDEKDGRHYQFSATVSQDVLDAYNALDFFSEDYEFKVRDLLHDIEIEDCIDFTDEIIPDDQLTSYTGKKIGDLVNEGFNVNGYSFWEEGSFISLEKDMFSYQADVEVPEGFDLDSEFEYEHLYDFTIKSISFDSVEYAVLPMR